MQVSDLTKTQRYLQKRQRHELAYLLGKAVLTVRIRRNDWSLDAEAIVLTAPRPHSDALRVLPKEDRERLADALCENDAKPLLTLSSYTPDLIVYDTDEVEDEGFTAVIPSLIFLREVMIDVATGGFRIQDRNEDYIVRHNALKERIPIMGLEYPIPYDDLWQWYEEWKGNLPSYQHRRQHIRSLINPLIAAVLEREPTVAVMQREPTGWERADRALATARKQFENAINVEDFQSVGLLCREVLITVAQAVYLPDQHKTLDGVAPSTTDAKRMMEAFLHTVFPGDSFKEVRAHARASIDLSLNLQHRRTATRQLAALCLEATASTGAVMRILSEP